MSRRIAVALLSSLLAACLVAPAAAREYSIWEWWTDRAMTMDGLTPVHPDWGNAYTAWTPADIWGQYVDQELWTPAWAYGKAKIKFEYAGWALENTFGGYDPGTLAKTEIFSGPDDYLTGTKEFSPGSDPFGFYLGTETGTRYTEAAKNGDTQWVKVFDDPRGEMFGQILCWEDKNKPDAGDFTAESLTRTREADFNDLVIRVTPTPELSIWVLLACSGLAGLVLKRRKACKT